MKKSFFIFTFLLNSFSNYAQIDFQLMWTGYTSYHALVDFSHDGNNVLSLDVSTEILKVYDANSGGQIWAKNNMGICHFSPDDSKVVGINSSNDLCIYNRNSGALIWKDSMSNYGSYIMSPNSNFIFATFSGDSTKLFNLNNGNIVWIKYPCVPQNISFDNTKFSYLSNLSGVVNDSIIICDLISGNKIWDLPLAGYSYKYSGFSPDNNFFTITSGGNNIKIFNCNTGALVSTIPNGGEFLKYSADNLKLFSSDDGSNSLFVYNAVTHLLNCVINNNWFIPSLSNWYCSGDHYHDKYFDALSNKVAFIGLTGFGVFNTNNGVLIGSDNVAQQFSSQTNIQLSGLALSPDGTKIFTAEEEPTLSVYTVKMWSINVTGISNINNQNSFYKIYPVPVTQNLSIEIMNESKVKRIELFDLQGKLLSTQNSEGKKFSLDVHSLISGTYLLKLVHNDGKIDFEKFIK